MQKLPLDVKNFINSQKLGYVATVSEDGTPNLSPKGTIITWDDQLVFADIRSPKTMKNLEMNPSLEINIIDPLLRKGFRFKGTATLLTDGTMYDSILKHYRENGLKSQIGRLVLIEVMDYSEVISPLYDLGATEEEIKEKWKKYFSKL